MSDIEFGFSLLIWLGAGMLQLAYFRRNYTQAVGLTLIYCLNFVQNYGLVPIVYYYGTQTSVRMKQSVVGYEYCTIALACFTVGSIFIAPIIIKNLREDQAEPSSVRTNLYLPVLYITLSIIGFFGFAR